jgi:fused signal recognition particle receptor
MGILDAIGLSKLKQGLSKTREGLLGKLTRLVSTRSVIDDDTLEKLEEILIGSDVGVDASLAIIESVRRRAKEERYANAEELSSILKGEILQQLGNGSLNVEEESSGISVGRPHVIMLVGVNGVGKTTTIGKLAHLHTTAGRKVLIAAADTFRAAANEQLAIWADRAGAEIIQQHHGADPAAVAFDAFKSAASKATDVLLVDTAGRLHTRINLMDELSKIKRVLQKGDAAAPHEVLLVIDAATGQNGLQQAKRFAEAVGVTGIVLTKLDGTARGGIVLAIAKEMKIPVKYVGVGEGIDDLQPFDRGAFVDALFAQ